MQNRIEIKNSIAYLMNITNNTLKNYIYQKFKAEGLDVTHDMWIVLNKLCLKDGQNQQEIANSCDKDKSTICRIVDNLIKRNLAIRASDKIDRRNNLIFLTNKGKEIQDKLLPIVFETLIQAQNDISEHELECAKSVLTKILQNLLKKED